MTHFLVSEIDQTVQQFLDNNKIDVTISSFLEMKRKVGKSITNWDAIKQLYSKIEIDENEPKYPSGDLLIKQGTAIVVENSVQDRDPDVQIIREESTLSKLPAFISQKLADLLNDPNYQTIKQDFSTGRVETIIEQNDVTVYIWCRAVDDWIDISHHINQVNTSVTSAGGVFTIALDDIECVWKGLEFDEGEWEPIEHSPIAMVKYRKDGSYKRPNFYLNTVLAENDLVYIKLGKLSGEKDDDHHHSTIEPAHKIWDMIGLIDKVSNQVNINSTTTTIQGRDLIKLLIEDGSIFFSSQFLQNIFVDPNTLLARRNLFTKIEQSLIYNFASFKSVGLLLQYVVNKYSNIGIIPNSAFHSYGDSLMKEKYDLKKSSISATQGGDIYDQLDLELPTERQGLWRITDFVFDKEPGERLVSDSSFSQDNGSMINSIRKLCQEPFIEFRGDTYGDRYNFVVRKQPFDKNSYTGLVYGFVETDLIDPIYSFEKKGKDKLKLKNQIREETNQYLLSRKSTLSNYCIDIDDSQVLSHQLSFHREAYSWYRLIPRGLGTLDEGLEFALTPIVAFDEYAQIWGSKTMSIESNYTPSALLDDKKNEEQLKYLETQGFLDLQFLIQSNAYLPFTRQGSITIVGNRTIKRGLFIFFKPTNEVFYVDSVSHVRTVGNGSSENNMITTLQVSRGMVEPFIKGLRYRFGEGFEDVSYFNIINTDIDNKSSIDSKDTLKNWKVNKNVFDFFVQRRQFTHGR